MQIFEFHFNPSKQKNLTAGKDDFIFDSFCYEPENVYEKRMGSLYMAGSLKNVLPQNLRFLDNLARIIREKYYKTISPSPEKSLREALRKANDHLEKIARQGDVSWLGNMHFGVISLKNSELNFAKVGDLKVYLLRKGYVTDVNQKMQDMENMDPYPLKVFGNIVTGKLAENDILMIMTKEIADFLAGENLIKQIARLSPFNKKKLQETMNGKKEELAKISGLCLLIYLSKEAYLKEKETLAPERTFKFNFSKISKIAIFKFNAIKKKLRFKAPKINLPAFNFPGFKPPSFNFPKIKLKFPFQLPCCPKLAVIRKNRKAGLILFLSLFLIIGFFIFEKTEQRKMEQYLEELNQIERKVEEAETYLLLAETSPPAKNNANMLFNESWEKIAPLIKISSSFPEELKNKALDLENKISENLFELNKLIDLREPEIFFEFNPKEYVPRKIAYFKENLYFFTSLAENVLEVKQNKETNILVLNKNIDFAASLSTGVLFFAKPDQAIVFQNEKLTEPFSFETPYADFNFNALSSYQSHLYFLDKDNKKIIKYPYTTNFQWGKPELWFSGEKVKDSTSLTIDGSIWTSNKDNTIERYYAGTLRDTVKLNIFPAVKNISKVFTGVNLPYLYILEPGQNRIIILDKTGQIVKQYRSNQFDNLLDFSISQDGQTIYLLNGLKVFKIQL